MAIQRKDVPLENQWNLNPLYSSFDDWEKDYQSLNLDLSMFKGKIAEGAEVLKDYFNKQFAIMRKLMLLYTYAHLRHDEDITNDQNKQAFSKIMAVFHQFQADTAWFEPELISLSEEKIENYLSSEILKDYQFYIEKIVRIKKHTLSPDKEEILALAEKPFSAPPKAFSAINDADFKFGKVLDKDGKERELTHATLGIYMRDQDRTLRENSFKQFHRKYNEFENTLTELLSGVMEHHAFNAKVRHYATSLDAALFPNNIDTKVYHSLIEAVNNKIDALHKYISLRKKVLGLDELHLYDMNVPLTADIDIKMTYKEAEEIIIESVKPLGSEYQNLLKKGLEEERWVDRYENENKRSGAYSSGCYDSMPYILMNYKELLRDVFTLAHEAGHSMHSLLSHTHQPYQYGHYSIFLAEVASTFNEDLLTRLLLERSKNREEKIYLINQKIEDIRATLFRQTMFAEFELMIHDMAEKNIPLTPKTLKEEYVKLNKKYYGETAFIDNEIAIEWSRIPHFYYNYYVYQYATGISAALALSDKVVNGDESDREAYLSFLKGGSSKYPIDMLQMAGVDMRTPRPVEAAINKFSTLVDQLDQLITPVSTQST